MSILPFTTLTATWLITSSIDMARYNRAPNTIQLITVGVLLVLSIASRWIVDHDSMTRYVLYALLLVYIAVLIGWGIFLVRAANTAKAEAAATKTSLEAVTTSPTL